MNIRAFVVPLLAALFVIALIKIAAHAEVMDMPPEKLKATATHIVVGKVVRIYSAVETEGKYEVTRSVAEIAIEKIEKGEGLKAGEVVHARYWRQAWQGRGTPPPGTGGHRGLPKKGDAVKVHLVNKGYNGGGDTTDGGYDVILPNGFSALTPEAAK